MQPEDIKKWKEKKVQTNKLEKEIKRVGEQETWVRSHFFKSMTRLKRKFYVKRKTRIWDSGKNIGFRKHSYLNYCSIWEMRFDDSRQKDDFNGFKHNDRFIQRRGYARYREVSRLAETFKNLSYASIL